MKYKNATTFRNALEGRISNHAKKTGLDIQRLRRDVAFDRLIVRLFAMPSPPWALKGGYAMQLRTESARATKDVDLAVRDAGIFSEDPSKRNQAIQDVLIKQAAIDNSDFFQFRISAPKHELNAAPEGGVRFHVEARLDDRSFEKFLLDIGIGDVWNNPLENLKSSEMLKFAGIEPINLPAIPKEQQFAEKIHAYTLPRPEDRPNSRVKDLIDMNLLVLEQMDEKKVSSAIDETFKKRNTHQLSLPLQPPPETWGASFTSMAIECDLDPNIENGFSAVAVYLNNLKK